MPRKRQKQPKIWMLTIPPDVAISMLLGEGLFLQQTRLMGQPLDPDTRVLRTWYDGERDLLCFVLEGENGMLTAEGDVVARIDPILTMANLDYETPDELQALLGRDDVGPGLRLWIQGLIRDVTAIALQPGQIGESDVP